MAGGQISQKIRDFVVIIHKSRPIVKSRASGGYRRGIAPVEIAQELAVQTVAVCGILSRSRPSCSRPRCCTRRCCRCRYSVRCSSSAVPLAPSACPCCCNGTRSAEPICISANCAAAGAQFFLRPAGVRESTGAQAGQKNRRHTSVCRRFVHLALRSREPLIDGPAYHGVF